MNMHCIINCRIIITQTAGSYVYEIAFCMEGMYMLPLSVLHFTRVFRRNEHDNIVIPSK